MDNPTKKKQKTSGTPTEPSLVTLSGTLVPDPDDEIQTESYCGSFRRERKWSIVQKNVAGVIVQHVTRQFTNVREFTGDKTTKELKGNSLNQYVGEKRSVHANVTEYWELWEVKKDGKIFGGADEYPFDVFQLTRVTSHKSKKVILTTKGKFEITGTASFYYVDDVPKFIKEKSFVSGSVACAGDLYARSTKPTLPFPNSNKVVYTVTSSWDSSKSSKTIGAPGLFSHVV